MSLATLSRPQTPPLPELVDALARRTGGWVLVEQLGSIRTHGAGRAACPPALVEALISKSTAPLRAAVEWVRSSAGLHGRLDDLPVTARELGDGATAWFVGAPVDDADVQRLAVAVHDDGAPVVDAAAQELLHPRGPSRGSPAPAALLVVLRSTAPVVVLGRAAVAATAGVEARVHSEHDTVVVALPLQADPALLVADVRSRCPDVVAGAAHVLQGAPDWTAAARVATACADTQAAAGTGLARAEDPAVAAELVVAEAQEAARALTRYVPHPLRRLQEHDARSGGELQATLTAWCRADGDVAEAAAALHVHPNTLRYRLRRASAVSGLDLDRPRHVLALQLLLPL